MRPLRRGSVVEIGAAEITALSQNSDRLEGGPAVNAGLIPMGMAVDSAGNLFIASASAVRVVKGYAKVGTIVDFGLTVGPNSQTATGGTATNFTVNTQSINGFSQPVALSAVVNPPNSTVMVSFSQNSISPDSSATLTVKTAADAPTASVTITVTGTAGQKTHSQKVTLNLVSANVAPGIAAIADQTVSPGEVRTVAVSASDPNGNTGLKLSLVTAPPCVTIADNGNGAGMIRIAPGATDKGGLVTVRATDPGGLTGQTSFNVVIAGTNHPPTMAPISDQSVNVGEVRTVQVSATDPDGPTGLKLSLTTSLGYVTLTDNGSGSGNLRIAPTANDLGGRVTVQVTDPGGLTAQTSFNILVFTQSGVTITNAAYTSPNLVIQGSGFGTSGAVVKVNGQEVSQFIKSQNATAITLKGKQKKLNLKAGANQITVTVGGATSNTFVLSL